MMPYNSLNEETGHSSVPFVFLIFRQVPQANIFPPELANVSIISFTSKSSSEMVGDSTALPSRKTETVSPCPTE